MQHYTTSCGLQLDYCLKRSRRRTIGFHIRPHGLEIRAPRGVAQHQVERAIESKKNWLKTHLYALQQRQQRWLEHNDVWRERGIFPRSEEHTSELQSRAHLVCRLLREKTR